MFTLQVIFLTIDCTFWPRSTTLVWSWSVSLIHRNNHFANQVFSQEHFNGLPWRAIPPKFYERLYITSIWKIVKILLWSLLKFISKIYLLSLWCQFVPTVVLRYHRKHQPKEFQTYCCVNQNWDERHFWTHYEIRLAVFSSWCLLLSIATLDFQSLIHDKWKIAMSYWWIELISTNIIILYY